MKLRDIQRMLAKAGYYKGGLDGIWGPKTKAAIEVIERTQFDQYPRDFKTWSFKRRLIAAGQAMLNAWDFNAGDVDGYYGHNTAEAFNAYEYTQTHNQPETVSRNVREEYTERDDLPTQAECAKYYGTPGKKSGTVRKQLVIVELPFKLRIDWNLNQTTSKIRVHKRAAPSLARALSQVANEYGLDRMRELGIDRYAGAYNPRMMRGGRSWSMHAYGCAIDFFARPNGLRTKCPRALFCRDEYQPFLDIMENNGWLPAIRLWGRDAMHFQRARL